MKQKNVSLIVIWILAMIFSLHIDKSYSQVTDKDGRTYKTVKIGIQEWTAENLNVEHYRNGDVIPQVQDNDEWKKLTTGAWCYYENDSKNGKTFGKLYNWYAVNDSRGLAPKGWHIPSDEEWKQIIDFCGGEEMAGGKLKDTNVWDISNYGATNESGFSAIPGGFRGWSGFGFIGYYCCLWSASANKEGSSWGRKLRLDDRSVSRYDYYVGDGLSIRCIKD